MAPMRLDPAPQGGTKEFGAQKRRTRNALMAKIASQPEIRGETLSINNTIMLRCSTSKPATMVSLHPRLMQNRTRGSVQHSRSDNISSRTGTMPLRWLPRNIRRRSSNFCPPNLRRAETCSDHALAGLSPTSEIGNVETSCQISASIFPSSSGYMWGSKTGIFERLCPK